MPVVRRSGLGRGRYGSVGDTLPIILRAPLSTGFEISPPGTYNYSAFPALAACADGELLALWHRAGAHNEPGGKIVQRKTVSGYWGGVGNETLYWDTMSVLLPDLSTRPFEERQGDTNPVLRRLANDTLLAAHRVRENPDGVFSYDYFRRSTDNGATWSDLSQTLIDDGYDPAIALPRFGYDRFRLGGKPLELAPGGTLLLPCYGDRTESGGGNRYDLQLAASADEGETWELYGEELLNPGAVQLEEPQLGRLDDGRLMLTCRVDNDRTIRSCYSSDDGLAWTPLQTLFTGYGRPNWLQLSNGVIILFSRHYEENDWAGGVTNNPHYWTFYRISRDRGVTWGQEQQLTSEEYLYADLVESEGILHVIHAYAISTSLIRTVLEYMQMEVV